MGATSSFETASCTRVLHALAQVDAASGGSSPGSRTCAHEGSVETLEVELALGMRGVLAADWSDGPVTPAVRKGLKPRLAAKCAAVRVAAIAEYERWVNAYRSARARFVAGERGAEWPLGTYWMSRRLGCPVVG